jgi:hypothetical protein
LIERKKIRRADDRELLVDYQNLIKHQCPVHDIIQNETKEHREMVCGKIAKKADVSQVRSILWMVSVLITICCLVVAGGLAWLKIDMASIKQDAIHAVRETDIKIEKGFRETKETTGNLHRRISEYTAIREEGERAQTKELEEIKGELKGFNWRMLQLEERNKKR